MNATTDFENLRALYQPRIPNDWRNRLPDPAGYYPSRLSKLGRPNGKAGPPVVVLSMKILMPVLP